MNAIALLQDWVTAIASPLGPRGGKLTFAFLALLMMLSCILLIKAKRIGVFRSTMLIAFTALFAGLAYDLRLIERLNEVTFLDRIRLLMGTLSFLVLLVTFEAVRRLHLQERYALLWLSTGIMLLLCALFTSILDFFCDLFGMQYITFIVAVIFTFLLLVSFHFSIAMSRLAKDRANLAQRTAQLEARIEQLEKQRSEAKG
ncbi:MAG: DUF2304 domain-containing protein [Kiritimatiellae bacterium]|nr:DUF2304 domain-containing protein [Kiritimatiellia bacterium]